MGNNKGLPSEAAAGYGTGLAHGHDWQQQSAVGISIIKVRMNEKLYSYLSYIPGIVYPAKKKNMLIVDFYLCVCVYVYLAVAPHWI